jgi:hypothetical protein
MINNRGNFLKDPANDEQFDHLLKELTGHSLKEDAVLWTAFQHLRSARNKFVHEGVATIGGRPVEEGEARVLMRQVNEIISWVRDKIPPDIQWPIFDHRDTKVEFSKSILMVKGKAAPEM